MSITEQIKDKVAYVKANYAQPKGTKQITANGPHDVKDYASVFVAVEGGTWGGTNDVTIRFLERTWGEEDGERVEITAPFYSISGYYQIDGGSPVYFSGESEIVLSKAVGVGDSSTVLVAYWCDYYGMSETVTGCEMSLEQVGDSSYEVSLFDFTGDATLEVVAEAW